MTVRQRATHLADLGDVRVHHAALENLSKALHMPRLDLGEVAEGLPPDLAGLVGGMAKQDGGRAASIGSGLDVNGHGATNMESIEKRCWQIETDKSTGMCKFARESCMEGITQAKSSQGRPISARNQRGRGLGTTKLLLNFGLGKEGSTKWTIRQDKVERARKKDGWHGMVTNLNDVPGEETLGHYRGLWQAEAAFRTCKFELQFRPVFHWTQSRIHAHVAIDFMTLMCARHLQHRLRLRGHSWTAEALSETLNQTRCHVEACAHIGRRFLWPPFMTR